MALLKKKEGKEIIVGLPGDEQIEPTLCFGGGAAALRDFRVGQPGALVPWVAFAPRGQQCDSFRFLFPFLRTGEHLSLKSQKEGIMQVLERAVVFFVAKRLNVTSGNAKCTLGIFFRHRCWSR